jgi:hypothetical protein
LKELYSRPEKVIIVVSHSGFLTKAVTGGAFANADYRIYDFASDKEPFELREWTETREGHGGMGESWDVILAIGDGLPEQCPPPDE